ncbi:MAG: LysR family transcriptional regulator [Eubacteriales bacterium]|nr:LysR family transcriptional regulator [Eubacteriales bacterium]
MNESLERYRIFYYTALCGNITAAAEKLYVSQPAVSQSIKQLERSLGCALFVRTSKGVTLTAEGKTLFQYVSKGVEQFQLGENRLREQLALDDGVIYIGASDMTLEFFLLPYLEKFHRMYPKIRISVTNGPTPETIKKLDGNLIDFGVVTEPVTASRGYGVIPVKQIEDIFICGKEYKSLASDTFKAASLAAFPLVMLESNTSTRRYAEDFLRQNNVNITPEFELATSSLIVQFVKRGLGIGCVVRDFAEKAMEEKSVFKLTLDLEIPKRNICIVKKDDINSKAAEKLLELLLV